MGRLLARATYRATRDHVRHVVPVAPADATGPVASVYRQLTDDFGMLAPPVLLHSPAPDVLAACWVMLRETLIASGRAPRAAKETVAAAVSQANRCPYCVTVHGSTLDGLLGSAAGRAVLAGEPVADDRLAALARAFGQGDRSVPPPVDAGQLAELTGVAVTFHYLNRMVNVFLRDSPLPDVPARAADTARRVAGRMMGRLARPARAPGRSLDLLPRAAVPADLDWARSQPRVAEALSRAYRAIDTAGAAVVPAGVRELLADRLPGPPPDGGPGGEAAWLAAGVAALPPDERPAGRLALLTAAAAYRVTPRVVADCRATGFDDAALVRLTAWAALTAARRVEAGLARPARARRTGRTVGEDGPGTGDG
ncbi:carboxymuconolactone decarboxylase family protein [Micromonospora sp. NPDC050980]|uniref:carboxymuconolactone decarboxylase family protein n=1 Tax=Micromonospora sp. NPDC050980 TaxID=3155161 RepID=UPI0033C7946F